MVIAYLGLVSITVSGFVISGQTVKKDATRKAAAATRKAAVQNCLASRPTRRAFSTHLKGVNSLAEVFVTNAQALLNATSPTDPEFRVRIANLGRAERARKDIAAVRDFPVPTKAQCRAAPS